jgi:hypothetical protein
MSDCNSAIFSTNHRTAFSQTRLRVAGLCWAVLTFAMSADAKPATDCPLRDQPYSIDSPLIDVLLKPEARLEVERAAPSLLKHAPQMMLGTTPPTFSTIITLRSLAGFERLPEDALVPVNDALAALSITRPNVRRVVRATTSNARVWIFRQASPDSCCSGRSMDSGTHPP